SRRRAPRLLRLDPEVLSDLAEGKASFRPLPDQHVHQLRALLEDRRRAQLDLARRHLDEALLRAAGPIGVRAGVELVGDEALLLVHLVAAAVADEGLEGARLLVDGA